MNATLKNFPSFIDEPPKAHPKIPADHRVYCIGDIHGQDDLLHIIINKIVADTEDYAGHKVIVFLGDYIDRGLSSKEVVDFLIDPHFLPDFEKIFLCGNHEQTLLKFLYLDSSVLESWWHYGAQATFYNYGVPLAGVPKVKKLPNLQKRLKEAIPPAHLDFFMALQKSWSLGDYYFVHAGIRPGVALDLQDEEDLLWIREEFLTSQEQHEKVIIHGHSIEPEPTLLQNRIGIDTGAYISGRLTCLVLENESRRLLNSLPERAGDSFFSHSQNIPYQRFGSRSRDHLTGLLSGLMNQTPEIEAAAFISIEGKIIISVDPKYGNRVSSASLSKNMLDYIKLSPAEQFIARGNANSFVLLKTNLNKFLLVKANNSLKLEALLQSMRNVVEKMRT